MNNGLLCKAKATVQQSSGCWIRDRMRGATKVRVGAPPVGFTMGATTLNLFTHLLGHAPPPPYVDSTRIIVTVFSLSYCNFYCTCNFLTIFFYLDRRIKIFFA